MPPEELPWYNVFGVQDAVSQSFQTQPEAPAMAGEATIIRDIAAMRLIEPPAQKV
jgi:hypothetical protein